MERIVQIFVTFVYIYSRSNDIDRRRKIDQFRGGIVQVDHAQGHEWVRGARFRIFYPDLVRILIPRVSRGAVFRYHDIADVGVVERGESKVSSVGRDPECDRGAQHFLLVNPVGYPVENDVRDAGVRYPSSVAATLEEHLIIDIVLVNVNQSVPRGRPFEQWYAIAIRDIRERSGFNVVHGALLVYRVSKPVHVVVADSYVGIVEGKHHGRFVEIGRDGRIEENGARSCRDVEQSDIADVVVRVKDFPVRFPGAVETVRPETLIVSLLQVERDPCTPMILLFEGLVSLQVLVDHSWNGFSSNEDDQRSVHHQQQRQLHQYPYVRRHGDHVAAVFVVPSPLPHRFPVKIERWTDATMDGTVTSNTD